MTRPELSRTETDSFGPIEVPADAYWGAQTQRSIENFPFGSAERMPLPLIHALGLVKQAAARVNRRHGLDATDSPTPSRPPPPKSRPARSTTNSRSSSGRPAAAPRPT